MKREWKPGDVARVNGSIAVRTDDNVSWWTTSGRLSDPNVAHVRPLVVIDPDSPDDQRRILTLLRNSGAFRGVVSQDIALDCIGDALREFANPTPPEVYEHFALPPESGKKPALGTSLCGKVWRPGADVKVVGRCPECAALVEGGWLA